MHQTYHVQGFKSLGIPSQDLGLYLSIAANTAIPLKAQRQLKFATAGDVPSGRHRFATRDEYS